MAFRVDILYSCFLILSILTASMLCSVYITLIRNDPRHALKDFTTVRIDLPTRKPTVKTMTMREHLIQKIHQIPREGLGTPPCPHVLIFTHPRSGSTLTGHIIQQVYDSFYAFEPLRYLSESLEKGERIVFPDKSERLYQPNETTLVQAEILYRWFTCDFDRVNLKDLSSLFIREYSINLHEYAQCVRRTRNPEKTVPECIPLLKGQCNRAKVRLIKTVRLGIESVELLLHLMPNLRVIYLARDPRGKLSSQMSLQPANWEIVTFLAKDLCELLSKEINYILELREIYPQRLKILIYERFAYDPVECSRRLFEFINLRFTTELKLIIKSLTMAKVDKTSCYWCAKRTDSYLTANKWRKGVLLKHIKKVDKICSVAYQQLGYRTLSDETTLRNISLPLFVHTNITHTFL